MSVKRRDTSSRPLAVNRYSPLSGSWTTSPRRTSPTTVSETSWLEVPSRRAKAARDVPVPEAVFSTS